jgi:hypothetical protein
MPIMDFESETKNFFFEQILPTLDKKLQKIKWEIINIDEPQNRQKDTVDEERILRRRKQAMILGIMAAKKIPQIQKKNIVGCLMMNKDTNWKWAWCAAESATNNFLVTLSPEFKRSKDADEWIRQKIEMNLP